MATVTRRLAALLGASGAGLTDSATASKITTDSINDDAVNAAKIAANAVGTSEVADNVLTATDLADNSVGESELSVDYTAQSVPHIVPGVLQPAVAGKLLNGATHSGAYGTAQTQSGGDGHSYYYTDIKGSKPIKDPRIGAYFGSQRHMFKSIQQLEQETATHGSNVYSIDGRDWMRGVGALSFVNDLNGIQIKLEGVTTSFYEITGYFNAFNFINFTSNSARNLKVELDGVTAHATFNPNGAINSPLGSRYVSTGSVFNVDLTASGSSLSSDTTLGIHTIRISWVSATNYPQGCELIAQDLSGSGSPNRSKIKFPVQNVVSFGKKFPITETNHHYDPFSAKTDGSAWTSPTSGNNTANSAASWPTNIDTTYSLGLENWVNGSSYYRPYNGGRVVKYVDSTGTIKTAVTVMPPNARAYANANNLSGGAEKGDDSAGNTSAAAPNDNFRPTFTDQTIATAQDLHEIAKAFHYREFGNGAANGGASSSFADASMFTGAGDIIGYVMDDGLTSFSGEDVRENGDFYHHDTTGIYLTFIGTGISFASPYTGGDAATPAPAQFAQNLPYGTHVLKIEGAASYGGAGGQNHKLTLDGVIIANPWTGVSNVGVPYMGHPEFSFYQPKKPSIPEDAVVLADYMLMADFVAQSTTVVETAISKGVRVVSGSRDHFIDGTSTFGTSGIEMASARGFQGVYGLRSGVAQTAQLPFFGTRFLMGIEDSSVAHELTINGTSVTEDVYDCSTTTGMDLKGIPTANVATLGVNTAKITMHGSNSGYRFWGTHVDNPIHTSSHYQAFETPFLHELVGGDRNMEQMNLVCSPDGKTWDEITRDTSYIKKGIVFLGSRDGGNVSATNPWFADYVRGQFRLQNCVQKEDIAIAYDRLIFLKSGTYAVDWQPFYHSAGWAYIGINDTAGNGLRVRSNYADMNISKRYYVNVKRGDYLYISATNGGSGALAGDSSYFTQLSIEKV